MANKYLLGLSYSSLLMLSYSANAAVVNNVIHEDEGFVQRSRFSTEQIELTNPGQYELMLTDYNFGSQFDTLMVTITTGVDEILSEEGESFFIDYTNPGQYEGDNGIYSDSWTFTVDAGTYFLNLWADVNNPQYNDIGYYGVRLSGLRLDPVVPVPLPPALVFLGSALVPLAGYSRRKRNNS